MMRLLLSSVLMLDFCFLKLSGIESNSLWTSFWTSFVWNKTTARTFRPYTDPGLFRCPFLVHFIVTWQNESDGLWIPSEPQSDRPSSPYPHFTWQDMLICYQHHAASSAPPCSCGIHSWTNLFLYICCWLLECLIAPRWLLARCLGVQLPQQDSYSFELWRCSRTVVAFAGTWEEGFSSVLLL